MDNSIRLVTFDVYTALADLEASLLPMLDEVRELSGATWEAAALLSVWRAKQMEYALLSNSLDRGRPLLHELTLRSLHYAAAEVGAQLAAEDAAALLAGWEHLVLWPEAEETIAAVRRRGTEIGVLSNGDENMLVALVEHWKIPFDHMFSAQWARAYKPRPEVYRLPCDELGLEPGQILHVAGSATDVMGAKAAGLRCYWSNRVGDRITDAALVPDYEAEDLYGLLDNI